jgi:hypothetical protein
VLCGRSPQACRDKVYNAGLTYAGKKIPGSSPLYPKTQIFTDAHDRRVMEHASQLHVAAVLQARPVGFQRPWVAP